jgi:hypothetical protein
MERSHQWLKAIQGYDQYPYVQSPGGTASQADAQTSTSVALVLYSMGNYIGMPTIATYRRSDASAIYSGWLRVGTSTQLCGWLLDNSTSDVPLKITTPYGFTSVAPVALSGVNGNSSTYDLKTSDVEQEIVDQMKMPDSGNLGFIYDASIGQYGRVTWLSQI